jgi:hypothetical protein
VPMRNFEVYSDSDKVVYSRDCYAPVTLTIEFSGLPGAKPTAEQMAQISRLQGRLNIELNRGSFDYVTQSYPNDWVNCTHRAALYLKFLTRLAEKSGWQHQFACEAWFKSAAAALPLTEAEQTIIDLYMVGFGGELPEGGALMARAEELATEIGTTVEALMARADYLRDAWAAQKQALQEFIQPVGQAKQVARKAAPASPEITWTEVA